MENTMKNNLSQTAETEPEDQDDGVTIDPATGTATITLKYPYKVGDRNYDTVTIRRVKGSDLAAIEAEGGGEAARSIELINRLAGKDLPSAGGLDAIDVGRINQVIAGFLGLSPSTGET